jgi:hypothetical protein
MINIIPVNKLSAKALKGVIEEGKTSGRLQSPFASLRG